MQDMSMAAAWIEELIFAGLGCLAAASDATTQDMSANQTRWQAVIM
jgi:hypothetical protein